MTSYITDTFTALAGGLTSERGKFKSSTYSRIEYTDEQMLAAYEGSPLVKRVVDMPAEDATRMWREWQAEDDQISKIEEVENRFKLKNALRTAYQDARIFGDGYIYFDDGTDASEELVPETSRPLRFVVRVPRWQISEGEYNYDPMSPFYNKPSYYHLMGGDANLINVHPSRIVHLVGSENKSFGRSQRLGRSVIATMLEDLKAYDAVLANVAEMTMEAKVDVVRIKNLMRKVRDPEELAAIQAKVGLANYTKGTASTLVLDMDNEEWSAKTLSFATLPDVIDRFQIAASGAAEIPRSRLFGVQTGGLGNAGESDREDYHDRIKSIQENKFQQGMNILDKVVIKTALGSIPPEVHYNWRSLWQVDDKTKQEIGEKIVKRYVDLVSAGIYLEDLAYEQVTNELVEAGVAPGLEQAAKKWAAALAEDDDESGDDDE